MRPASATFLLLVVASVIAAGCTAPTGTPPTNGADDPVSREGVTGKPGDVGGSVRNSPPEFVSSAQSATTGENRGEFSVVFSGQVKDANTEQQIKNLSSRGAGPTTFASSHEITTEEKGELTEPVAFGPDGWKVWSGGKNSGILNFAYRQEFPALTPPGEYSFTLRVEDTEGAAGTSNVHKVVLTAYSDITIDPVPVGADGAPRPTENWGMWSAEAGARDVESTNYLKLVNTGQVDASRVVIDFAPAFVGATDANFTIPVPNNVQFAWWEDTTPRASAPSEGSYSYATANADGTVTVQFSGKSNVIYVTYRIGELPEILPVQSYGITFTVTEL